MDARNTFTGRGIHAFVSWNDSTYKYTENQLYLGYNPLSNVEIVTLLNINNTTRSEFFHNAAVAKKYNPKVYTGYQQSYADGWQYDNNGTPTPPVLLGQRVCRK